MLRRHLALVALLALAACKRSAPPPPPPEVSDIGKDAGVGSAAPKDAEAYSPRFLDPQKPGDPIDPALTAQGAKYMVTSESWQASEVGRVILSEGGNAVDAAVAVAFALAVVHPSAGNIGGGGFAIVRTGPGQAEALDFRETAPAAATKDMFLGPDGKPMAAARDTHLAAGVPGSVAGLWELHQKYGKLEWADLITPAIKFAREGFPIDAGVAKSIKQNVKDLLANPATGDIWVPKRIAPTENTEISVPDLAATLERIAQGGPKGFYEGKTAELIVAEMKAGGGIITADDLKGYKAIWREPLRFSYRGNSIISMPPPSSGGVVLALTAGVFGQADIATMPWHSATHIHRLIETWRRAYAVRNEVLGDPAYVKDMPLAKLLSKEFHAELAAQIGDQATPSKDIKSLAEGTHTTHLNVVDAAGMAVALTTTLNAGWGSGITVRGAGFLLNNEMDDFTAKPGSPNMFGLVQLEANKIEPGKRMLSSMSPTIVEDKDGKVWIMAGAGGGPRIITAVWQTISNVIDYGQTAALAVANKRVHHQHLPDTTRIEEYAIDQVTATQLAERGQTLDFAPTYFASITAIVRTSTGWDGTADPRGGGAAKGD